MYYFYAYFRYLDAQEAGELKEDADPPKIYVCVPTGNFGNALAGFYARTMGLPIERLVIATNHNDIIYRFMAKGDYSARPVRPSLGSFRPARERGVRAAPCFCIPLLYSCSPLLWQPRPWILSCRPTLNASCLC